MLIRGPRNRCWTNWRKWGQWGCLHISKVFKELDRWFHWRIRWDLPVWISWKVETLFLSSDVTVIFGLRLWDQVPNGEQRPGLWGNETNWCFWTVLFEKTLKSPLDCKEIQPVHTKGDQSWVFIGRTDAEAETPVFWPPHGKSWFIGKDLDAGRDWGQGEKGMTEDEMAGWHHRLDGHEFE